MVLLALYLGTAAPDLTFWDATELSAAAHTLGIPHPPGTPLWVLLGRVAALAFQSSGPARAITLLSVLASALAGGLGAAMATRWIGARGAVAGAAMAGGMMTVWSSATETEVYAVALLFSVALVYAGERAGRHDAERETRVRWRGVIVLLAALAVPLHLSVLVALPAAVTLAWRGPRPTARESGSYLALGLLGVSAIAVLPILAGREPALDAGHPVTIGALVDLLTRAQYDVAGLWPRSAPLWLQLGNVLEWTDWQVAFGLTPHPQPSVQRTSLTVLWAWLALFGVRALWQHEARVGRGMTVLLVSGTIGVALWLNLKAGPSYGVGVLPADAPHEARERDYFFMLGFWAWGLAAGAGLSAMAQQLSVRLPRALTVLPFALAAVPLVANRPVMDRRSEPAATLPRTYARLLLESVPANGVLYTAGDNDSFPLWYLQHVESVRTDVLVVTVPLLGAEWYRAELARRHAMLPTAAVTSWPGLGVVLEASAARARAGRRPIRVSALLAAADRRLLAPTSGWALEGLVYAKNDGVPAGQVGLDATALRQARDRVPPSALRVLPGHLDPVYEQIQTLLRCTQVERVDEALLVGACNGG